MIEKGPKLGQPVEVRVGSSVKRRDHGVKRPRVNGADANRGTNYLTLSYDFLRSPFDEQPSGTISLSGAEAKVDLTSAKGDTCHIEGVNSAPNSDFLLIYEDDTWRLERVAHPVTNLRVRRQQTKPPPKSEAVKAAEKDKEAEKQARDAEREKEKARLREREREKEKEREKARDRIREVDREKKSDQPKEGKEANSTAGKSLPATARKTMPVTIATDSNQKESGQAQPAQTASKGLANKTVPKQLSSKRVTATRRTSTASAKDDDEDDDEGSSEEDASGSDDEDDDDSGSGSGSARSSDDDSDGEYTSASSHSHGS